MRQASVRPRSVMSAAPGGVLELILMTRAQRAIAPLVPPAGWPLATGWLRFP